MKNLSFRLLFALTFIIPLYGAHKTALSSSTLTEPDGSWATASATIEDLGSFFRRHSSAMFPEEGFANFTGPFQSNFHRLKNLAQMRALTMARERIPQMVALAYYCFTREIENQKKPLSVEGFSDVAASRLGSLDHYRRSSHCYFLAFQRMLTSLLEKKGDVDSRCVLEAPCGISPTYSFAWLHDCNGVVPVPLASKLRTLPIYHAPLPYGDWRDDRQRAFIFREGRLITERGMYVSSKNRYIYKIVLEGGDKEGFRTNPLTARALNTHPFIRELSEQGLFIEDEEKNICAFIGLPEAEEEEVGFEAALLEALMLEAQERTNPFAMEFLTYAQARFTFLDRGTTDELVAPTAEPQRPSPAAAPLEALEEADPSPASAAPDTETTASTTELDRHIDLLYEDQIHKEQEKIRSSVAARETTVKVRKKKEARSRVARGTPERIEATATASQESSRLPETLKHEILTTLKEKGRERWRVLIKAILSVLKNAHREGKITFSHERTTKGSHIKFHLRSGTGSGSTGITLIRPHGGGERTLPAGKAQSLVDNLISLIATL